MSNSICNWIKVICSLYSLLRSTSFPLWVQAHISTAHLLITDMSSPRRLASCSQKHCPQHSWMPKAGSDQHWVGAPWPDLPATGPRCLYPDVCDVSSAAESVNICVGTGFMRHINIYLKRNENGNIENDCFLTLKCLPFRSLGA